MEESAIVKRAKAGDEHAFEQLVLRYEKKVYNLAYRYMGNEFDALDISQETFLRVYRFLPQFNEESLFSTWLFRIATNVCKDSLRKKSTQSEISLVISGDEDDYLMDLPDLKYSPENKLEQGEMRREIADCLKSISPDHREILIMRDIMGLPYEDIAQTLKTNEGTVKSRISRAREKMRTLLAEKGNFFENRTSNKH